MIYFPLRQIENNNQMPLQYQPKATKRGRVIDTRSLPDISLTSCHLPLPEVRHACPFVFIFVSQTAHQ